MPSKTVTLESTDNAAPPSLLREFWVSFSASRGALFAAGFFALLVIAAIFAPWLAPHAPAEQFRDAFLTPPAWQEGGSLRFLLGTDEVGRDILSRLLHGARLSLMIGLVSVLLSALPGFTSCIAASVWSTAALFLLTTSSPFRE